MILPPDEEWVFYSRGPRFEEDLPTIMRKIGSAQYEVLSCDQDHYIRRLTDDEED